MPSLLVGADSEVEYNQVRINAFDGGYGLEGVWGKNDIVISVI
jgi:hypothetical protein